MIRSDLAHRALLAALVVSLALATAPLARGDVMRFLIPEYPLDALWIWVLLRPAVATCIYLDCRSLSGIDHRTARARNHALLALLLPLVATVRYLSARHDLVENGPTPAPHWVVLVPAALLGALLLYVAEVGHLFAVAARTRIVVHSRTLGPVKAVGGLVLLPLLPVGAYMDSRYLSAVGAHWRPDPGRQVGLALLSMLPAFLLVPVYVGYYLRRRRRGPD